MELLKGTVVRKAILEDVKKEIEEKSLKLKLAIIYVGYFAPSEKYIANKIKYCDKVGIETELYKMPNEQNEDNIINLIESLNKDDSVTGIILQSPLPDGLDIEKCIKHIDPKKDIDGFTKESFYYLSHGLDGLRPCTVKGIIELLKYYNISLDGKHVVIIGRGNLVGKPLFLELLNHNATVTCVHTHTKNIENITKNADIIIAAAGCPKLVKENWVSKNAVVVDVGISVIEGQIIGDVDFENVKDKCLAITPNPGGVGPMTVAIIIKNILDAYNRR